MYTKRCSKCHKVKEVKYFYDRDDGMTVGVYAWCIRCMEENGRSPEYPPMSERGGGKIG